MKLRICPCDCMLIWLTIDIYMHTHANVINNFLSYTLDCASYFMGCCSFITKPRIQERKDKCYVRRSNRNKKIKWFIRYKTSFCLLSYRAQTKSALDKSKKTELNRAKKVFRRNRTRYFSSLKDGEESCSNECEKAKDQWVNKTCEKKDSSSDLKETLQAFRRLTSYRMLDDKGEAILENEWE